ncbi:histidine phosphatase family protein [Metabacillus bambusae]|uniref:Histidine phosphatase family protein n=1 Tax=Metabacillus bambusae TaxID=2795218 RepID=A0ABS3N0F4_9BACI|nr:histidine phosphatase family protein [Metabacillus bambusae]MBO1511709.1 histidine phosphatase family protein [Metabacillus bambusae]
MSIQSLKNGGYIVYFRHGEATVGRDQPFVDFDRCETQRNLNETGRRQAILIGEVFRKESIPLEPFIISSPYCRALNTAKLAFSNKPVRIERSLARVVNLSEYPTITDNEKNQILNDLKRVLEIPTSLGENRVVFGHSFPKGIGLGNIEYMVGVIIKPKGQGKGYEEVDRINFNKYIYS